MTPVAALWTKTSSDPSAATCSTTRDEVTLPRTSTGSAPSARSSSAVSSAAASERKYPIATRARALAREAQRDRLADPARAAGDEDRPAGAHSSMRRGSGFAAVADDGIVSQPIRSRDSGSEFSAFVEANPSRSSSSICRSP